LPDSLTYAPVDFDQDNLPGGILAAGFAPTQQTFFTWLGVVPYLAEEAVWATLAFITSLPNGAHVVFDDSDPPDSLSPEARILHDRRAAHVEALDESFVTHFEAEKLQARLIALGFSEVEDLGPPQISARYFPNRSGAPPNKGGHILRATTA
jgi:O-methyltransferase involved in polyketide biosynthesis